MDELYELKEKLCKELKEYGEKDMSAGSLEVIDKLTHAIKNLDKIIESYDEEGYSGRYSGRNSYYNMGRSYARGNNARRDSRGRYSREYSREYSQNGYSYDDGTIEELKGIMEEVPSELKQDIKRVIRKMESM